MEFATLPFNQNRNGWLNERCSSAFRPSLIADIDADWVIIGSGFAGLSFARRLAILDPSQKIVMLDAACAAESASARNSGFVIGLPHNIGHSTAELKKAHAYRSLLQEGSHQLEALIALHGIDCEWENAGKYHCQVDVTSNRILREYIKNLEAIDEPYRVFDREMLYQKLGSRFYTKAIYTPGATLVNPASLVSGLANSLPENVILFDNSPVMQIVHGETARVITPYGTVRARKVMLATNAQSNALSPRANRQAAMATFASFTAPLTAAQAQRLPEMSSWGLTPVNAIAGATIRFTRDRRFLIRQHVIPALRGRITAEQTWQATRHHQQIFSRIYPQLSDVPLIRTWSGTISVTRNSAPVWGKFGKNVYISGGCNGAGITKQTIAGYLLADYALGHDNPLIANMLALGKANYLPPSPILDAAISLSLAKERYLGRSEV